MKKVLALVLALALTLTCVSAEDQPSGIKMRVGTMANALGLPLVQAQQAGYFKDAGIEVEIVVFATGAPINEAMGAEELDVAVSGMASVYALATGRYKYIGDGVIATGGDGVYARPDSPIVKVKGKAAGTLGDAASVKDADILGPLATSGHYTAIKYVESLGLTADDFNMVSMDYPQAYQAFVVGQGDMVASTMPYSAKLDEAGFVKVAELKDVTGMGWMDTIFAQDYMVSERRGDLLALLDCYYRASEDLKNDEALRRSLGMAWYKEEGKTYTDFDMDTEIQQKAYHTLDSILTDEFPFGSTMLSLGEFFTIQGMIDEDNLPNIAASMDPSMVEELKAKRK